MQQQDGNRTPAPEAKPPTVKQGPDLYLEPKWPGYQGFLAPTLRMPCCPVKAATQLCLSPSAWLGSSEGLFLEAVSETFSHVGGPSQVVSWKPSPTPRVKTVTPKGRPRALMPTAAGMLHDVSCRHAYGHTTLGRHWSSQYQCRGDHPSVGGGHSSKVLSTHASPSACDAKFASLS